jgi:arylsulfatase A-like enzyme
MRYIIISIVFVVISLSGIKAHSEESSKKPNVIFILADDLGWSDTELYGTTKFYETPNINRLAERGIRFTNAYSANPLCSPTRASIMTGLEPGRIGFTSAAGHVKNVVLEKKLRKTGKPTQKALMAESLTRLDTKYKTLAETIKEAGYVTGHFGKWHMGDEDYSPLVHGFDIDIPHVPSAPGPPGGYMAPWAYPDNLDFDPHMPNEHIEDRMSEEAIAFLEEHKDEQFFLNYWAFSVHGPWQGKAELIEKYKRKADPDNPQRTPVYGAMVQSLDEAVGSLLDAVDRLGIAENTIIVFYSDNGGCMYATVDGIPPTSNLPLRNGKATIYEGGSRVPCAVIWPGKIEPNSSSDALITSTDWYPTLLAMLDIKKPEGLQLDGYNQLPALLGESGPRERVFCHFPHYFPKPQNIPSIYVREGDWKLIRFFCDNNDQSDRFELYNLKDDIGETKDLSKENLKKVKKLNKLISNYLKETEAVVPVPNPAYTAASKN